MAYEIKDMSGSLFKNDKREKDSHPNAKGTAKINGVEYWVSSWTKKDKNGNPWQSLSFQKKIDSKGKRDGGVPGMESDIPFAPIGKGISGHSI